MEQILIMGGGLMPLVLHCIYDEIIEEKRISLTTPDMMEHTLRVLYVLTKYSKELNRNQVNTAIQHLYAQIEESSKI